MSTHTVTFKVRAQRNGMIQVHSHGDIDLFEPSDVEAIGAHVMALLGSQPDTSRPPDLEETDAPQAGASSPRVATAEPVEAEPVSERESELIQTETERHVREAIDGMIPGGSRIIDILQTISSPEG